MSSIRTYSITDVQIYQEYQIANITSASTAQLLAFQNVGPNQTPDQTQILILEARGDNVVFNFGGSGVVASKTVTNNALPAGNFSIAEGAIFGCTVNGTTQNYVSCITESSGGTGIVRLGTLRL
jgi:hypothetical protein